MYYWLNLVEAGNSKTHNQYIIDKSIFQNTMLYNDNFNWFSGVEPGWNNAQDVENWYTSLPAQLTETCHWMKDFKLQNVNELKVKLSKFGLNNFDDLIKTNKEENIICLSLGFDWNGLVSDNKTLMEAATIHNWLLIDDENDAFPKLARANVDAVTPFQLIQGVDYKLPEPALVEGNTFYGSSWCIVKDGKIEEFKDKVLSKNGYNLIERGQKQEGNVFYIVTQDNANKNKFIWFEQWKDLPSVMAWAVAGDDKYPAPSAIFSDPKVLELFIDNDLHVESPKGYTELVPN